MIKFSKKEVNYLIGLLDGYREASKISAWGYVMSAEYEELIKTHRIIIEKLKKLEGK